MRRLAAIVAVAILARAAVLAIAPPPGGLLRVEPSELAANLDAGRGFVFEQYGAAYRAWKEPLYIFLLAGLTRAFGNGDLPILVLQWLTGSACGLAAAAVALRLLGRPGRAALAGTLVAADPFLVYYDTHFVHPLSLDTLLFLGSLLAVLWALEARGPEAAPRARLAGAVAGVCLWQRATLLASGAGALAAAALFGASRLRGLRGRQLLAWSAVALAVLSPWLVRNWLVIGRPVVTTDFAHILWLGNNPWSNGTYGDAAGRRVFELAPPDFQRRVRGSGEVGQYELFLGAARDFALREPGRAAGLVATRLLGFFWLTPNAGIGYARWQALLYACLYAALLGLGLAGLRRLWQRAEPEQRDALLATGGAVLGLAAVHALTALNLKHRVPFEVVLCLLAAETLAEAAAAASRLAPSPRPGDARSAKAGAARS